MERHLAGHWRVDIRCDLDALDDHCAVLGVEGLADGGELDVDDLSELLLRVVGDADPRPLRLWEVIDPLVTLGELSD